MSKEELSQYWPDTPTEWAFIGSSINRLGGAMTMIGAMQGNITWVLFSGGLTWFGHEVSEYFKVHSKINGNK